MNSLYCIFEELLLQLLFVFVDALSYHFKHGQYCNRMNYSFNDSKTYTNAMLYIDKGTTAVLEVMTDNFSS